MAGAGEAREELLTLVRSLKERVELDRGQGYPLSYLTGCQPAAANSAIEKKQSPGGTTTRACEEPLPVKGTTLEEVRATMDDCHRCSLGQLRHSLVFGEGNPNAELVFVGEAPGADEDAQGRPFVGAAGQLLTKIIEAMGLKREDVYICNILKCRPPENRNPKPDEIAACEPFLMAQLQAIGPKVICALGTFAAQTLLKTEVPISALRGRFHVYQGIPLMPTYHPAYLLRNPSAKKQVWADVQLIMNRLRGEG
ncbi:MAG: uracil-DNA glycosylase [Deltaproteobacteria bacterium]|nr:uracil-DNA glycosylase [Deltaproteobacteria bacterium]